MDKTRFVFPRQDEKHDGVNSAMVLGIIAAPVDRQSLKETLNGAGWGVKLCESLKEARRMVPGAAVVLCDEKLPDGTWRDLLPEPAAESRKPAIIVASRLADERLWIEVLDRGGHDLLPTPLRAEDVIRSVEAACVSLPRSKKSAL